MKSPSENEYGKHLYQELLAIRAKRGDKEAFDEIVRTFERPLFYYVRRLVESDEDAWDVLQEIWVKAFRGLGSLRETKRFCIWLYAIAHCTVMSHYRAAYRSQEVLEEAFGSEAAVEVDAPPNPEDAERVHLALAQLDPDFRAVLTLRFLEQLSVEETAEIIGVPSGTVKSRLFHAKKALKKILTREDGIPVKGTHAHSWVMAFESELDAFNAYADALPNNCIFLVDTYESLEGVRRAVEAGVSGGMKVVESWRFEIPFCSQAFSSAT